LNSFTFAGSYSAEKRSATGFTAARIRASSAGVISLCCMPFALSSPSALSEAIRACSE
jgi:hypothetical protein